MNSIRAMQKLFPLDRSELNQDRDRQAFTAMPRRLPIRQTIECGRRQGATSLWAVLQGQTMVRMAGAVAEGLNIPLRVQVWDPLAWWLRAHGVDRFNRKIDLAKFDETLRRAEACATASWAMAREYEQRWRHSLPRRDRVLLDDSSYAPAASGVAAWE